MNPDPPKSPLKVLCRPALETDTPDVMALTKDIWEGGDYVPQAWAGWLADPDGLLAVAEHQGTVLGMGKLTRLSQDDWWLEGLRVHPQYEGRGIASQLDAYLLDHWLKTGGGAIRLATSSKREKVHHMCQRNGFTQILDLSWFIADSIPPAPPLPGAPAPFTPCSPAQAGGATAFALDSETLAINAGLMDLYWQWAPPDEARLAEEIERGRALWWRDQEGLLVFGDDKDDDGEPAALPKLAACRLAALADFLLDFRRLAAEHDFPRTGWLAPLHPQILAALESAGFKRDWESSLYLFAREHPHTKTSEISA